LSYFYFTYVDILDIGVRAGDFWECKGNFVQMHPKNIYATDFLHTNFL